MSHKIETQFIGFKTVLCEEHGWFPDWFYDVDPSPEGAIALLHFKSLHYCTIPNNYVERAPAFCSRVLDRSGRQGITSVEDLCRAGRQLMFLREPFDRLHDSYRPQAQYLTHMREVGISNSLFEQPLEIVGDSYMSIIVRPKNRFAKINFGGAGEGVEARFQKNGTIEIPAALLLWHKRVLLEKTQKQPKQIRFRAPPFWLPIVVGKSLIRKEVKTGCGGHPEYIPNEPNRVGFCHRCDEIRALALDLDVIDGTQVVTSPWET